MQAIYVNKTEGRKFLKDSEKLNGSSYNVKNNNEFHFYKKENIVYMEKVDGDFYCLAELNKKEIFAVSKNCGWVF